MVRSGLVCASRLVGTDWLSVGSYVRFKRGCVRSGLCESFGKCGCGQVVT